MKRRMLPLVVLLFLGGFASWWFSPGQIVKRRTGSLLQALTLESGSGVASRQLAGYSLNELLADEVAIDVPKIPQAEGVFARDELESAFASLCKQAKQTRFDLREFRSIRVDGDQADAVCSLDVLIDLSEHRPVDGRFEVTFHWRHGDDGWRLSRTGWVAAE